MSLWNDVIYDYLDVIKAFSHMDIYYNQFYSSFIVRAQRSSLK